MGVMGVFYLNFGKAFGSCKLEKESIFGHFLENLLKKALWDMKLRN